ncbi:hypothetical protein ACLOJK_009857 [Asimina triloba]
MVDENLQEAFHVRERDQDSSYLYKAIDTVANAVGYCNSDDLINVGSVGCRRGLLGMCHADADLADVLGMDLAGVVDREGGRQRADSRYDWRSTLSMKAAGAVVARGSGRSSRANSGNRGRLLRANNQGRWQQG